MLNESINHAVVCLATYKRPAMLHATLISLLNQNINFNFTVYVVENEAKNQDGLKVIHKFNKEHNLNWVSFIEEKQGNVHALNAVFTKALKDNPQTQFFLMIDDDEIAEQDWLATMVQSVGGYGIVGGPVHPLFERETKAKNHPVYHPAYSQSGEVPLIYGSGNCLITRPFLEKLLPLDVTFNHLGGADTDFFHRAKRDGAKFYWCENAKIYETVPEERLALKWLFARSLRIGALNALVDLKQKPKLYVFIKNIVAIPLNITRAIKEAIKFSHYTLILHPLMITIGRFLPFLNLLPKPYKG